MYDDDTWETADRHYTADQRAGTFTKRQLHLHERKRNIVTKQLVYLPLSRERLENEHHTLELVAAQSCVPVPRVISGSVIDGVYTLVMEYVDGIHLKSLAGERKVEALANVNAFIHATFLPEMSNIRSTRTGACHDGTLIPQERIVSRFGRDRAFKSKSSATGTADFVLTHRDLAQHNILINRETLQVETILDWEYSGFYPPGYETLLWNKACDEDGYGEIGADTVDAEYAFTT